MRKQTPKGLENRMCVGLFLFLQGHSRQLKSNDDHHQSTTLGKRKRKPKSDKLCEFVFVFCLIFEGEFHHHSNVNRLLHVLYNLIIFKKEIRDKCLSFERREFHPSRRVDFLNEKRSSAATPLQNNKTKFQFFFHFPFSRTR